jgi:type II secretory pathway component PulM
VSEALSRFWKDRTARERMVVTYALAVVVVALAYVYGWLPVTLERDRLLVRVPELRADAQAMERDSHEVKKLQSRATAPVGLRETIRQASERSQLPETELEIVQQDPSRMHVAIASARFDHAFDWISRLQLAAGTSIEYIRVTPLNGDRVRVEAMVIRSR